MSKSTIPNSMIFLGGGKSSRIRMSPSYPRAVIATRVRSPWSSVRMKRLPISIAKERMLLNQPEPLSLSFWARLIFSEISKNKKIYRYINRDISTIT